MGQQSIFKHQSWRQLLPAMVPALEKLWPNHACKGRRRKNDLCQFQFGKTGGFVGWSRGIFDPPNLPKAWLLEKSFCWLTSGWTLGPWKRAGILSPLWQNTTHSYIFLPTANYEPKKAVVFQRRKFCGHVSKMAHSISFGVSSTRISTKLCPLLTLGLEKPLWLGEDDA